MVWAVLGGIGIVLLYLLSFIIFLALIILFVPFYYASRGSYYDDEGGATAIISWLYGAVSIRYSYHTATGQTFVIRLFGVFHKKLNLKNKAKQIVDKAKKTENIKKEKDKKKESGFSKEKLKVLLKSMKSILKRYKPRRLNINATVGFDDAYYTGLMCAGLSAVSPMISNPNIRITPDFDSEIYEGNYQTSGRIVVFFLAWEALKVFFSRPFRKRK